MILVMSTTDEGGTESTEASEVIGSEARCRTSMTKAESCLILLLESSKLHNIIKAACGLWMFDWIGAWS